jgi:hypothetical protein
MNIDCTKNLFDIYKEMPKPDFVAFIVPKYRTIVAEY